MSCHYPAHLGQSSQDSKKSLKNCRVTRGRFPSTSLGALNVKFDKGLHTVKHFQAMPQTLAARGRDKSPQNPSHRMIPQQEYNLWKPFPSWINLKNPRGLPPTKMPSLADWRQGLFPQQHQDSPAWVCLSDYYKSKDHNSSSLVD